LSSKFADAGETLGGDQRMALSAIGIAQNAVGIVE
jgi:hypothetical protein